MPMIGSEKVTLFPFRASDQREVKELILAGLTEHWGQLDLSKNQDLNDIQSSYKNGIFLVAWQDGNIVGTGGLIPGMNGQAEIVRMSVAQKVRQRGIGRQILLRLTEIAQERGFRKVILETTAEWKDVIAFYQHNGFRITHYQDGNVYFELELLGES